MAAVFELLEDGQDFLDVGKLADEIVGGTYGGIGLTAIVTCMALAAPQFALAQDQQNGDEVVLPTLVLEALLAQRRWQQSEEP